MAVKDTIYRYRWAALGLALVAQIGTALVGQSLPPLAPLFQPELGLTKAEVGLLTAGSSMGAWCVVLIGGYLTDRFGIRQVVSLGLVAGGALLLLMSTSGSALQAMVIMFAAGLARGTVHPGSTKIILDWFPPRTRATAMGVKQMGMPIAGFAASLTLPSIGLALGWRSAFIFPAAFVIAGGIGTAMLYREVSHSGRVSSGKISLRTALMDLIRNRTLWVLCSVAFSFLVVQLALITYLALYFSEVVLVPQVPDVATRVVVAGGFLGVCQMGGAVGRVFWGVVSDRLFRGRRAVVLAIVGAMSAVMTLGVGWLGSEYPLWLLGAIVFLYGAVAVGWNGVYQAVITETVGRRYAATGLGLSMTLTEGGTILGPPLFGLLVDLTGSYRLGWVFLACFGVFGTLMAAVAARGEKRRPGREGRTGSDAPGR